MTRTMALPAEGFLLEYTPGHLVIGSGPLDARPSRSAETPACYTPDFLLTTARPWLHPATWRETSRAALRDALGPTEPPRVAWEDPDADAYAARFAAVMERIGAGHLTKAVPIILERGTWQTPPGQVPRGLVARALAASGPGLVYAEWTAEGGMVGASPEVLFVRELPDRVETVAVAGTYPEARAADLAADPKERREHDSVVDDIVAALAPLGAVRTGACDIVRLPAMAHLKTDIGVDLAAPVDFDGIVRALHPTAALGTAPRSAGRDLLAELGPPGRERFGAPFGIEWPDGRAHVVVAIRNVQWTGPRVTLGAGAGLIAESRLEREWEELRLKRAAVKGMFGL